MINIMYCFLHLSCGLCVLGSVEQGLPNWLTGIIAVAVFLFLAFVAFLVNKAWCEDSR